MKIRVLGVILTFAVVGMIPACSRERSINKVNTKVEPQIGKEYYPLGTTGGLMIFIPAGKFMMGCNKKVDKECGDDEKPYHRVYLDAFYIDKYEVTVDNFAKCVQSGRCKEPVSKSENKYCNWGYSDRGNHPVNCLWWNAKDYCRWAGKRLPTEAEWEKAARGTDGRIYPWGNQKPSCEYAVMNQGVSGCDRDSTWPVGSKPKGSSPYGAMDMAGNIWEEVSDVYSEYFYRHSPSQNPSGPSSVGGWVLRGGAWNYSSPNYNFLRSSSRGWDAPMLRSYSYWDDTGNAESGFRCARDAEVKK